MENHWQNVLNRLCKRLKKRGATSDHACHIIIARLMNVDSNTVYRWHIKGAIPPGPAGVILENMDKGAWGEI